MESSQKLLATNKIIATLALDLQNADGALQFRNAWTDRKLDRTTLLALEIVGNLESALHALNLRIVELASLETLTAFGVKLVTMDLVDAETSDSLVVLTLENALAIFMEVAPNARTMLIVNGAEPIFDAFFLTQLELAMELNQFITTLLLAHVLPIEIVLIAKLPMDAVGAKTRLAWTNALDQRFSLALHIATALRLLAINARRHLDALGAEVLRHVSMQQQVLAITHLLVQFAVLRRIAILAFRLEVIAFGARTLKIANLLEPTV
jgi:hypothetical protein